jgi:hypothetical protein
MDLNLPPAAPTSTKLVSAALLWCGLALGTGCQNGPVLGRMKQFQLENERLLSEFRSQRREVEQLRADRDRLLQQQAETEKLAAKLQSQLNGRQASLEPAAPMADRRPTYPDPPRLAQGARPSPGGRPTPFPAGGDRARASGTSAATGESLQWRPIRKP